MGGIIYKTKQGDMWDYIAWKVYGDESYVNVLYNANPRYLKVFIFEDGCEITCPEVSANNDSTDTPEWRDMKTWKRMRLMVCLTVDGRI